VHRHDHDNFDHFDDHVAEYEHHHIDHFDNDIAEHEHDHVDHFDNDVAEHEHFDDLYDDDFDDHVAEHEHFDDLYNDLDEHEPLDHQHLDSRNQHDLQWRGWRRRWRHAQPEHDHEHLQQHGRQHEHQHYCGGRSDVVDVFNDRSADEHRYNYRDIDLDLAREQHDSDEHVYADQHHADVTNVYVNIALDHDGRGTDLDGNTNLDEQDVFLTINRCARHPGDRLPAASHGPRGCVYQPLRRPGFLTQRHF
jgi:hypothetical protein